MDVDSFSSAPGFRKAIGSRGLGMRESSNKKLPLGWLRLAILLLYASLALSHGQTPCTYSIDPTSRVHDYTAQGDTVNVTAPAGCDWVIINTNDWMDIKLYTNGTGNGIARYIVFDNEQPYDRSGVITIAGLPFTVTQLAGPCAYSILPTNDLVGSGATFGTVTVFTPLGCNWTVINTNSWITLPGATSGTGGGTVNYAVPINYTSSDRKGVLRVAG